MEDLRLVFEHLMKIAFGCKQRRDYYFVDADYYDAMSNHLDATRAYMLSALIVLKNREEKDNPTVDKCIEKLDGGEATEDLINEVLVDLNGNNIIS